MTRFNLPPWRIISDGKIMYVVTDNGPLKLIRPELTQWSISVGYDTQYSMSFDVVAPKMKYLHNSEDVLVDFFQSASIRDLLGEINKKIEERG